MAQGDLFLLFTSLYLPLHDVHTKNINMINS